VAFPVSAAAAGRY